MRKMAGLAVTLVAGTAGLLGYMAGSHGAMEKNSSAADVPRPPAQVEQEKRPRAKFETRDNSAALRAMVSRPGFIRFLSLWGSNSRGLFANKWLGVETVQNPLDVWITQEILYEVKPDFVVETGTYRGGSAALWATLLEPINPEARVITVDIREYETTARELPIVQRKVEFLIGSSTDAAIVERIAKRVAGSKVVVILDSDHSRQHVLDELRAYSSLVDVGSYLIVQDTGLGVPASKSWQWANMAVDEFLAVDERFEVDRQRERLVLTNNVGGFLRRVR